MADVTLKYKGATIGELSESGNKTIETAGKYCEADILLEYQKSAAGSILPENILKDLEYYPGYLTSSGSVSPGTNQEVYTDFFEVGENKRFVIITDNDNGNNWVSYCAYNDNKEFISRPISQNFTGTITEFSAIGTAKFIRFTFRTFGKRFYLAEEKPFIDSIADKMKQY